MLGEVELDYTAVITEKVDTKPAIKEIKETIKEEVKNATCKVDSNTKPAPVTTIKLNKSGLIAKKNIATTQVEGQDPVTGGATLLETVEGLPTGAGTGPVGSTQRQMMDVPPIRTQQMGLRSMQMIRLANEVEQPAREKPGQLSWVTLETEQAITALMKGPDITRQRCSECGF